jgi:hypothetical protein
MNIFDSVERTLVLSKNINVLDTASTTTNALKGIGEVTFTEGDTLNIDSKSYNFSVVEIENDGTLSPAYSNTYYDVAGIIEIKDEIFPALVPSTSITDFQRTFNTATQKWEHSTGDIRRYPDKLSKGALHTAAFYMTKFIGTVLVEGTLDNSPGINSNYATISTKVYNRFSGVDYVNFNGVFSSIRVRYIPGTNPVSGQNNDNVYAGTFDKLLLRS